MFEIFVTSELKNLQKQLSELERQVYPKAVAKTLNRMASSAKSVSAKHIAPMMNARQADIKRKMVEEKAYPKKLWASITAIGSPLKLIAFKAVQSAKGVVARAWGTKKLYRGTFIAPVKHGSSTMAVYSRKTKHSLPVKQLYGPGVAQLFKKPENIQLMKTTVTQRLSIEFNSNLKFYFNRMRDKFR